MIIYLVENVVKSLTVKSRGIACTAMLWLQFCSEANSAYLAGARLCLLLHQSWHIVCRLLWKPSVPLIVAHFTGRPPPIVAYFTGRKLRWHDILRLMWMQAENFWRHLYPRLSFFIETNFVPNIKIFSINH